MPEVLIALGSNVGNRLANMREAIRLIGCFATVVKASAVYETAPMYVTDQPAFYNAAILVTTSLPPHRLLQALKDTEARMGRHADVRFGPREIDLDIIAYGSLRYKFSDVGIPKLQVPHPRAPDRRFVLAPAADLAPDMTLPGLGVVKDLLAQTNDQADSVHRIEDALL